MTTITSKSRFLKIADSAEREQPTYRGFLAELLMAQCGPRPPPLRAAVEIIRVTS